MIYAHYIIAVFTWFRECGWATKGGQYDWQIRRVVWKAGSPRRQLAPAVSSAFVIARQNGRRYLRLYFGTVFWDAVPVLFYFWAGVADAGQILGSLGANVSLSVVIK